ncbi:MULTISPECIES: GntR family transcriptional regulator [Thermocrispum]|uniref:GntR family transcriptional regulator n=1 Tax=Thermocrispum agreste TaxID=37925 RepID=A0A2W4ITF9_9PSEU|nr:MULTISPECIES: GntR family transcriptional regulator [Thermocrispum]PZM88935.1 MAG: GntR family transcriptional regulator [Thermocrispum agreste]
MAYLRDPGQADPAAPVVAAPLADQVFALLRGWIINGELLPGDRLRIRDLADRVGTSVMPVREAVRRLVESGLAVHEPYKGATVRELDVTELEHAYDVRILLEGECARLGTRAAPLVVADRMQEHWELLEQAARNDDVTEALHQDELLLGALYEASGNTVLVDLIRGLWDRCRPYKVVWASKASEKGNVSLWHYKPDLIEAVRNRDSDAAADIVRTSYQKAKTAIREALARTKSSVGRV